MVNLQALQGILEQNGNVVDREGEKIGKLGQVYLDDQSNEPEWVTAATGMFGSSETFVPLRGAAIRGNEVVTTYPKDLVKEAPRIESEGNLGGEQEAELYAYYGLESSRTETPGVGGGPGHHTPSPNRGEAVPRPGEDFDAGTESRETSKARLRKYMVTEGRAHRGPHH